MKTCFKCDQRKPLNEFYKHSQMADGHLNKCKECAKSDVRRHRKGNPEKVRGYDTYRSKLPHRVLSNSNGTAEYRAKYPERMAANNAVARAVKSGMLVKQPCVVCGETRVEGHHPDYSKPLYVIWLCPAHHRQLHLAAENDNLPPELLAIA